MALRSPGANDGFLQVAAEFLLLSLLDLYQAIAYPNFAFGENLRSQPALVNQAAKNFRRCLFCQVIARFAQTQTANQNVANSKIPTDQRIQIDPIGYDISPGVLRAECDSSRDDEIVDMFFLDERQLAIGPLRLARKRAFPVRITVTLESNARNRPRAVETSGRLVRIRGDQNFNNL
jgi:hypothetical protein